MAGLPAPSGSADVLVLGSGGAGLVAALRCAHAGLGVTVLESRAVLGGTTAMSGAALWVPGNDLARRAGMQDSPEDALRYLAAVAPPGWEAAEHSLWKVFAEAAPEMLRFLSETTPLSFTLCDDSDPYPMAPGGKVGARIVSVGALGLRGRPVQQRPHIPHLFTYPEMRRLDPWHHPLRAALRAAPQLLRRLVLGERAQGTALVAGLVAGCSAAGVTFRTRCSARALIQGPDGRITGVRTDSGVIAARHAVVIATGGFERDSARMARHFAGPFGCIASSPGNLGEGQTMAEAVGAQLARMDQANIAPALPAQLDGAPLPIGTFHHREPGAFLVNRAGRRFVNEYTFNLGEVLSERDGSGAARHLPAWLILDTATLRASPLLRHYLRRAPKGYLHSAPSPEALACALDLPPETFSATLARFNTDARAGRDRQFERHLDPLTGEADGVSRMLPLTRAPYLALPFNLTLLGTKGGPRTDAAGRVQNHKGRAIPGLYACGLAMANPIGTRAAGSGTTLGPNLTWGYICAQSILSAPPPLYPRARPETHHDHACLTHTPRSQLMTQPPLPLAGQTALITGGARGIGRAITERLAEAGAQIALTANHDLAAAEATAEALHAKGHVALALLMDLTDRESVIAGMAQVARAFGRLDIVVNNAGTSARGRLLDLDSADWDLVFDVHTKGFFHVGTEAARHMQGNGGCIIAIAGASALRCYPGAGGYGPSKSAVLATVRQMAVEWAPLGIRANAVCPGPVREPGSGWEAREPALAEEVLRLPLPRAAAPAEIADAALYLATAGYVTGQEIVVDGGGTTTWYIQG